VISALWFFLFLHKFSSICESVSTLKLQVRQRWQKATPSLTAKASACSVFASASYHRALAPRALPFESLIKQPVCFFQLNAPSRFSLCTPVFTFAFGFASCARSRAVSTAHLRAALQVLGFSPCRRLFLSHQTAHISHKIVLV
jgi:hypothetical protein